MCATATSPRTRAETRDTELTADKTAALVREIAAASGEQSTGAAQVNRAVQQLDSVIQQNASAAEEMAAAAEEFSAQAEVLQASIAYFNGEESRYAASHVATPPPLARPRAKGGSAAATRASLVRLHKAVQHGGAEIDMNDAGREDVRDREFTPYRS